MRVAITGAYGFVGSHMARHFLQHGYDVVLVVRENSHSQGFEQLENLYSNQDKSRLHAVIADILHTDELCAVLAGVETVIHCAAKVNFDNKNLTDLYETNVAGTASVVNASLAAGVKNLIHISSVAALGRKSGTNRIDEDSEWVDSNTNTDYAKSKHLAEAEVFRGGEEGLNVALICPGVVLGPWKGKGSSGIIYERAKQGRPFYPTGSNGFVGVRDVAGMAQNILEHGVWGKRFIAVAENITYKTLLDDLAEQLGAEKPKIALNKWIVKPVYFACRFLELLGIRPPFPSQALLSTHSHSEYIPKNTSLLPGFAFTPLKMVHEEAVRFLSGG